MHALGYVEGRNWVLDERYAEGKMERLAPLAQELIHHHPDVLLVATTPGNVAAKAATSIIPIVMVLVADPVGAGIVPSLARPGGNITGVTNIVAELAGKRLELLKEIVPTASRVAVIVNPDNPNAPPQMRSAEAAARTLGIKLGPVLALRSAHLWGHFERISVGVSRSAVVGFRLDELDGLVFPGAQQPAQPAVVGDRLAQKGGLRGRDHPVDESSTLHAAPLIVGPMPRRPVLGAAALGLPAHLGPP
jgi:hypothetical protein